MLVSTCVMCNKYLAGMVLLAGYPIPNGGVFHAVTACISVDTPIWLHHGVSLWTRCCSTGYKI